MHRAFEENATGQGKLLYHLPEIRASRTVIVLRNEADCEEMDQLRLKDPDGRPVATTTSGYLTGWLPKFAAALHGKNVVIMHVSDVGGLAFYEVVANSLDECSITHRQVNVPPDGSMSVSKIVERIGADWLYEEIPTTECTGYGEIQL
jgi:hypothetical protein